MSTTLIPPQPAYAISVGGTDYPKPKETELSPYFKKVVSNVNEKLALKTTKAQEMYPLYGNRVEVFNKTFAQLKTFLTSIVRANCVGNDRAAIDARLVPAQRQLASINFRPVPGLTAEIAILPEREQFEHLNQSIRQNAEALTLFLAKGLDWLVAAEQVGLIEWFGDKVCRFHFYLNSYETKDTILDRQETVNGRTHTITQERETTQTVRRERHQHDLVGAKANPLDRAFVPFRVEKLIDTIPDLFKSFFHVVTGQQIFEHVVRDVEQMVNTRSESSTWVEPEPPMSVYRYDPALVIGHHVIAGWDDQEEAATRSVLKEFTDQYAGKGAHFWKMTPADQKEARKLYMEHRDNRRTWSFIKQRLNLPINL